MRAHTLQRKITNGSSQSVANHRTSPKKRSPLRRHLELPPPRPLLRRCIAEGQPLALPASEVFAFVRKYVWSDIPIEVGGALIPDETTGALAFAPSTLILGNAEETTVLTYPYYINFHTHPLVVDSVSTHSSFTTPSSNDLVTAWWMADDNIGCSVTFSTNGVFIVWPTRRGRLLRDAMQALQLESEFGLKMALDYAWNVEACKGKTYSLAQAISVTAIQRDLLCDDSRPDRRLAVTRRLYSNAPRDRRFAAALAGAFSPSHVSERAARDWTEFVRRAMTITSALGFIEKMALEKCAAGVTGHLAGPLVTGAPLLRGARVDLDMILLANKSADPSWLAGIETAPLIDARFFSYREIAQSGALTIPSEVADDAARGTPRGTEGPESKCQWRPLPPDNAHLNFVAAKQWANRASPPLARAPTDGSKIAQRVKEFAAFSKHIRSFSHQTFLELLFWQGVNRSEPNLADFSSDAEALAKHIWQTILEHERSFPKAASEIAESMIAAALPSCANNKIGSGPSRYKATPAGGKILRELGII